MLEFALGLIIGFMLIAILKVGNDSEKQFNNSVMGNNNASVGVISKCNK